MDHHAPPLTADPIPHLALQPRARAWFEQLRDMLCDAFTAIEREAGSDARFERIAWDRPVDDAADDLADEAAGAGAAGGGGGVMSVMRGRVFEKVGVNVSTVFGRFTPEFAANIPGAATDPRFWASGISVVAHPANPHAPTAHMNTRLLVTTEGWFGGGGDLTPMLTGTDEAASDRETFHAAFRDACDRHDPAYYARFSEWCDRYFFLPHRNETRGVGGIFYDRHRTADPEADFAFTRDVGLAFLDAYPAIVRRRRATPFGPAERERQCVRRGRYVEFNLLHDRGTIFGLKTGGNVEAILMSLPPEARWP